MVGSVYGGNFEVLKFIYKLIGFVILKYHESASFKVPGRSDRMC